MADDLGGWGALYDTPAAPEAKASALDDVKAADWRNILVLGRATKDGVYPETLALVGRARFLADELGCRVEVLLIGEELGPATEELKKFPINTVYRVHAPEYAPIDHTAKVLVEVVRKRRPELVLVFQSRTGDAVTAFAANRFGVGFALGASKVEIDTAERRAVVTHESGLSKFHVVTQFRSHPQFVSVQRGLFQAPLEDPYAAVKVHDLDVDPGRLSSIKVIGRKPPASAGIATADRVVVAGARITGKEELEQVRDLAKRLGAHFGVTVGIIERGLGHGEPIVGIGDNHIAPKLLVTVGVLGALDFLEAIGGNPVICAIGCDPNDPIGKKAAYMVPGDVAPAVKAVLDAL
ncbi:MAG: FAD-binding protein [Candidatus Thermoplasmatota archaeon]